MKLWQQTWRIVKLSTKEYFGPIFWLTAWALWLRGHVEYLMTRCVPDSWTWLGEQMAEAYLESMHDSQRLQEWACRDLDVIFPKLWPWGF